MTILFALMIIGGAAAAAWDSRQPTACRDSGVLAAVAVLAGVVLVLMGVLLLVVPGFFEG
jgi:hypothetical protein